SNSSLFSSQNRIFILNFLPSSLRALFSVRLLVGGALKIAVLPWLKEGFDFSCLRSSLVENPDTVLVEAG
ncbi:hypothetical protein, partial [Endozoicomonas sp. SESOKO2]|uniref:hypothetical protein n=1 Tax=Endozoicomonas sp. SESOKO2 TaxID=2828743 RepID=UPI002147C6CC